MERVCAVALSLPMLASAFMAGGPRSDPAGTRPQMMPRHVLQAAASFPGGEFSGRGNPFAVESGGFPSLDSSGGFPSIGDGFPSIGEVPSRPRRGVMVRNVPADAQYEIRVVDREHKLGVTAVVETIATVKQAKFALCRTRDRAAAILDEFVFPVDVDSQQMAPLIRRANRILRKKGLELLWTAHTLTVRGLSRPSADYMSWKPPFNARLPLVPPYEESGMTPEEYQEALARETAEDDRMDAAFFADVNDEEYSNDAGEGLDKRAYLMEEEQLCEFEHARSKYRVMVYDEPVMVLAQWMEDGTWRLLKSVEAEVVEDAIAYKQLQNVDVELVE